MNFKTLTSPCADCPFLRGDHLFLSQARRQEIVHALRNDATFSCHKTTHGEWNDEGAYIPTGKESHCAGALIALHKQGEIRNNYLHRMAIGFFDFDPDKLDMSANVVDSLDEFMK